MPHATWYTCLSCLFETILTTITTTTMTVSMLYECIYICIYETVQVMTINGSDLVQFLLTTAHKVHTGILSCFSYIEKIIHFYWILQRVRDARSNQVILYDAYYKWNSFPYSMTPSRMGILSLAHNLLWSAQWKTCMCKTYWMLLSTPTASHYVDDASM